jgi:3-hydroxyacyl-CoA dehydrogenase
LGRIEGDPDVMAAVLIGGGKTFVAGADIREFVKIISGEKPPGVGLHPLLSGIEDCCKPNVMAIHGQAFGGDWKWPWRATIALRFAAPNLGSQK